MKIPTSSVGLLRNIYKHVLPIVHDELSKWKQKAEQIPNDELRKQALMSINTKMFHCEGGAIYGLLAKQKMSESIRFIIAYQTISDYLDNLCDRSTSLDPKDFQTLHQAMHHALTPNAQLENYYRFREEQDDGGYLEELVNTCQLVLSNVPHYDKISTYLHELAQYYCDLQIHKHVIEQERVPRLKKWFKDHKHFFPDMTWYEFSACSGSTLGIFCLVSYAFRPDFNKNDAEAIQKGLFPYVQGLHIMLDYFIDQEEDRLGNDLNFCFYYPDHQRLVSRLQHFMKLADQHVTKLPDQQFHLLINRGLLGIYLSDRKVQMQKNIKKYAKDLLKAGGMLTRVFYMNCKVYRMIKAR